MRRNNHQYKFGDKILVKRKKKSKHELKFMGPSLITQIIKRPKIREYNKSYKRALSHDHSPNNNQHMIKIVFTTQLFLFK